MLENIKQKLRKYRLNIRIKIKNTTFFFMISKTQTLEGITSLVDKENNLHIPLWDIENTTLEDAIKTLSFVQEKYRLSDIYVMSDKEFSYRAICFTHVDFKSLLKIILDTYYIDYNFFYWTVQRSKATIRFSQKEDRIKIKIIAVVESKEEYGYQSLPEIMQYVKYDTGNDKMGKNILIQYRVR